MRFRRRLTYGLVVTLLLAVASYFIFHAHVRGAAFVIKASGMQGVVRTIAGWESGDFSEERLEIPWRGGLLPARKYLPHGRRHRPFLLIPGVHASGVDEPRLMGFARDLASLGHPVLTAGPPDLARYEISPETTDAIEDAANWLATQRDLAPDGRIGMMGISFAGGLSIVAAGRPSLKDRVVAVFSLGGHGDLSRTLRFLCTGELVDGGHLEPHDYGVVIILLGVADRVVPPDQVDALRHAVLMFLEASRLDLVDKAESAAMFVKARAIEATLPEPSRTLMSYVNNRDVAKLGPILLPHVPSISTDASLAPASSPPPSAPVYLLHGTDDNVIPAAESIALAADLTRRGATAHVLETPLITHAEVDRASSVFDILRLFTFWGAVLGS
jgi:dienelactone hydrolase